MRRVSVTEQDNRLFWLWHIWVLNDETFRLCIDELMHNNALNRISVIVKLCKGYLCISYIFFILICINNIVICKKWDSISAIVYRMTAQMKLCYTKICFNQVITWADHHFAVIFLQGMLKSPRDSASGKKMFYVRTTCMFYSCHCRAIMCILRLSIALQREFIALMKAQSRTFFKCCIVQINVLNALSYPRYCVMTVPMVTTCLGLSVTEVACGASGIWMKRNMTLSLSMRIDIYVCVYLFHEIGRKNLCGGWFVLI